MEHTFHAAYNSVFLRPLMEQDTESLRRWRNESSLNRYLTAVGEISAEEQIAWYKGMLADKDQVFFAIATAECEMVGALALYGFDGNGCQIGKILIGETSVRGKGVGRLSFLMAMAVGSRYLGRECFFLSVHPDNGPARALYQKIGFQDTGTHPFGDGFEYEMEIDRDTLGARNPEMNEIIVSDSPIRRI